MSTYPNFLPVTPHIGLATWGMDEILSQNMLLLDSYIGGGSTPGTIVQVNGVAILSPLNLNNNIPPAPVGDINVIWQVSGSNISAYVPVSGIGSVTAVFATGIAVATPDPITAAGTINVAGSGNTLTAATAAANLAAAPANDVATTDGAGNVEDSGVLLSALALKSQLPVSFPVVAGEFLNSYNAATGLFTAATPATSGGTVTSFSSGNLSPLFTSSVATATTTPALTFALNTQTANTVFAGPTTGVAAAPTFRALVTADLPAGTGTVTSVSFTGGLISVATPTTTPAFTVAGTSGGIPYFSSASTWASSALLASTSVVLGGGAGAAPNTSTALTFATAASISNLSIGAVGVGSGEISLLGTTSGVATIAASATGLITVTSLNGLNIIASGSSTINLNTTGSNGIIDFSFNSVLSTVIEPNKLFQGSAGVLGWSSTTGAASTADTAFSRISAGVVGVGTGAAASVAGALQMTKLYGAAANGDMSGVVTGTTTTATKTFAANYTSTPAVHITCQTAGVTSFYVTPSTSGFTVTYTPSQAATFAYFVCGDPS